MKPHDQKTTDYNHIVLFSGGICSYCAALRVVAKVGKDATLLLFCDTRSEDDDLYRFLHQAADQLGARLRILVDGRTIWQVFNHERKLGNIFADPCRRHLKQRPARRFIEDHCNQETTTIYLGLNYNERHRLVGSINGWKPYNVDFPMCDHPHLDRCQMLDLAKRNGLTPPRLYRLGFTHNNCGGTCVKAGASHWRHLLHTMPERYFQAEAEEKKLQKLLGPTQTILRKTINRVRTPISLEEFRINYGDLENDQPDEEWGGCGCFLNDTNELEQTD